MTANMIPTYAEKMLRDMRAAVDLAHLPGGAQTLERDLLAATTAEVDDIAGLAKLISMAHAAFAIADAGIEGIAAPWYREIGLRLLRRSMDVLALVEASRELRSTSSLN